METIIESFFALVFAVVTGLRNIMLAYPTISICVVVLLVLMWVGNRKD